ncbi:hypothetical protein TNIN_223231 [Trichonephila inaurata madagascariensis]|uniref:C2H2-type domain-containing protein n=1 Tax=Trichonephila inaurata madagascariensis TaxID=2747483 RepID=A0A8X7BQY2_9ARAC|nr:hypothetical protein TNIN_223231 [Trichonephila inaurata madagascariensis]
MTAKRSETDTKYVCDTCPRTFHFWRHYLKHMQVHKDTVFQKYFECWAAFNSFIQYIAHFEIHGDDTELNFMYCSESFSSHDTLRLHQNIHTRGNHFICEVGHRECNTKKSQYVLLHGAKMSVNSGVCLDGFPQKKAEVRSTHHNDGNKQFSRHICGKVFSFKSQLKGHQETHNNEISHSCPVCDKPLVDELLHRLFTKGFETALFLKSKLTKN